MPAENLTLYAVWSKKPPTAKVTLHYDDKVQVIEAEIGSTLDMLDDFGVTKDGEIVSGWYFENSPVRVENFDVSEDCDLYAKWQSAEYITISVDQSYLNKADIEYKMPLDMTGYAKLTLPVVDDKNDIYNSVFGAKTELDAVCPSAARTPRNKSKPAAHTATLPKAERRFRHDRILRRR